MKERIAALRLDALPLSLAGVSLGCMLAAADYNVDWKVAGCMMLFVIFLHFTAAGNLEGNSSKGWRSACLLLMIFSGLAMLHFSFGTLLVMESLLLVVFGYMLVRTVVNASFVSRGKGIVYVFVLFGLVSVYGSYFLCSHSFGSWPLLFPALSMGFMGLAAKSDRRPFTIAMTVAGWLAMTVYACLRMFDPWHFLYILSMPLFFLTRPALAVFCFALLSGAGFLAFLV